MLLVGLTACSPHADNPGAVTADEERQLNDAAAMLDANSMDTSSFNAVASNESQP